MTWHGKARQGNTPPSDSRSSVSLPTCQILFLPFHCPSVPCPLAVFARSTISFTFILQSLFLFLILNLVPSFATMLSPLPLVVFFSLVLLLRAASNDPSTGYCLADCITSPEGIRTCSYKFALNPFASETGYFVAEGCDGTQPTLVLDTGVEYCFLQDDSTMWMHPLGFGYGPDGALDDNPELEPGVNPYNDTCAQNSACQHPKYYLNDVYLGNEADPENFGLDRYEEAFHMPLAMWREMGAFKVCLTITDEAPQDIFYFCHIHNKMSGRIKLADDGILRQPDTDQPPLGYNYTIQPPFDQTCGTTGVAPYEDYMNVCHGQQFVCQVPEGFQFGACMNALDCAMHEEMRVNLLQEDPLITFLDQMIPHHQNAVNMAKTTLKLYSDLMDQEYKDLMWSIINDQNAQITWMRAYLNSKNYPEGQRDCDAGMAMPSPPPYNPGDCIDDPDFCTCALTEFAACPVPSVQPGTCSVTRCSGYVCDCSRPDDQSTLCAKMSAEYMAFNDTQGSGESCSLQPMMNVHPVWTHQW